MAEMTDEKMRERFAEMWTAAAGIHTVFGALEVEEGTGVVALLTVAAKCFAESGKSADDLAESARGAFAAVTSTGSGDYDDFLKVGIQMLEAAGIVQEKAGPDDGFGNYL